MRSGWARVVAMLAGSTALFLSLLAPGDAVIVLKGRPAAVPDVGAREPGRGRRYPVRPRIKGEAPVEAWSERTMRLRASWSIPDPSPRPGDWVAVYLAPPDRIVPVSAVGDARSWVFPLGLAWTISAAALVALRGVWRDGEASGETRPADP